MAKETIETIRQAEIRAEQREKDAQAKAEEIVAKAHEEAESMQKSMTGKAREEAAAALKKAGAQGEEMMAQAQREVEQEVLNLQKEISLKESQAVSMIVAELV